RAAELRALAVRAGGAADPGAGRGPLPTLLPRLPLVPGHRGGAGGRRPRGTLALPRARDLGRLDPRRHAGPRHGGRDGHPRPAGRRRPDARARYHSQGVHRRGRGRHGQPPRVGPGGGLHQPARGAGLPLGEPGPGGDRVVRAADRDAARAADRPLRPDAEMTRGRPARGYWTGFGLALAALAGAALVLPEFWRRVVSAILIWGVAAVSC